MAERLIHVGIRQFREDMAQYLDSATAVAITRNKRTVGYYIPAGGRIDDKELQALKRAVEQLATVLAEHGISEDEVVSAFRARRAHSQGTCAGCQHA